MVFKFNKTKKSFVIKQIALFMAFLILSIPVFSAQAFALTITGVTITGSDGVEDVMKSNNDYFTATVGVSEEINSDQLQISYTKEEAFDSCSGKECTYTSSQTDRAGQEMDYTIQLLNASIVVDEVEGTILVDEEEPTIDSYTVEKSDDDITISYEVTDTACEDCSVCAGIDYLTLYQDETEIQTINVASECSVEEEISTSVTELNLEDGEHELCLIAVDNVGYSSDEYCEAISIDRTGPHFETGSLQIKDSMSGNVVEYVGSDAVLVDVFINVTDDSLSENTVIGDFSSLNSIIGSTYEEMTADSCEQDSDDETLWVCAWYAVYIEDVSGSLTLTFTATDNEGNEGTYSLLYTLTKDNSAPTVYRVYNEQESEDLYLKYGTNSVYADLDATGSGFSFEQAYLTFSLASLTKEDATDCWENGSYWTCVWNFSMSYSGTTSSSLTIDAEDDAGNAMESYDVDVATDSDEPEILSISTSLDCPTATDTLEVIVNATDDSDDLYITFYGEDIRTDDEPVTEDCVEVEEDLFTCTLYIDDFVSSPEDEDAVIEVTDNAGNIADDEVDISVCELEEAGTPDFVTTDVGDVVDVDKLTLSYIDYPLYVPLTFSYTSAADIVSKTASCSDAGTVYFIDQSDTTTFMVITLPAQVVPNATYSLNLDCSISFTMQYGDTVYSTPEIDEIEISVDLYGTPLGSVEESIAERIALQRQGISEAQTHIDTLVGWNKILGTMCTFAQLFAKFNSIFSGIRTVLTAIGSIPPLYELAAAVNTIGDVIYNIVVTYIWPVGTFGGIAGVSGVSFGVGQQFDGSFNTNPLGFIGAIVKSGCTLYSGTYCEGFSGFENEIIIKADEYGQDAYYESYFGEDTTMKTTVPSKENEGHYRLFYDWDPYKSIHTARSCFYIDAIIYNLRKERQINCMYTTCLEQNAENGLPIDVCDDQYDERMCLYVDGAAWLAGGSHSGFGHFVQLTLNTFLANLEVFALSVGYYATCGWYDKAIRSSFSFALEKYQTGNLPLMWAATGCHVYAGALTLTETNWFAKGSTDFDFQANLEGTDYCAGY